MTASSTAAKLTGSLLSGTALATLVVAGMLSPISVDQALAGCTRISTTSQTPEVRLCNNFNSKGYTLNSALDRDIEMYVAWSNQNHTGYSWDDGTFIRQEGTGEYVKVAIIGSNVGAPIGNIYNNPNLSGNFPLADNNLKVAFTSDGKDDVQGSDHAFQIDTVGGDIDFITLGDVVFRTTGAGRDGLKFSSNGGDVFIDTGADFEVVEDAIDIETDGGDATIVVSGMILADQDAILLATNGGDATTDVLGDIDVDGSAVYITTLDGAADTYVGADSQIEAGDYGVYVHARNGSNIIEIDGDIEAGQAAIWAAGSTVDVTIGSGATIRGEGTTSNPVIDMRGANSNTLVNRGIIASVGDEGTEAARSDDVAIEISRASALVENAGFVLGRFDGTNNDDTFENVGIWAFTGGTNFGTGTGDVLRNLDGESTSGDVSGFGIIWNALDGGVMETARYRGLETFENAGLIATIDQEFGDVFNRDRVHTEGDFVGLGGGLFLDADLSVQDSDRFIISGDMSGSTVVLINNIGTGPAGFNALGIPVIEVAGKVADGTEVELLGGPIDAGLFSYDLYYTDNLTAYLQNDNSLGAASLATGGIVGGAPIIDSMWVLAATLDAEAYQLPVLMYGAQNLWHASAGVWGDRTTDLRAAFGGFGGGGADIIVDPAAPATAAIGPGFWGRAFGGTLERDFDNSFDLVGGGVSLIEDSFRQNYYGVIGGLDAVHDVTANSAILWGLLGGLTGSDLDFDLSGGSATYEQVSLGAYATWINGGFFADVLAKADFGNMDYSADGDSGSSSYTSVGVTADVGYRFGFATGWFVEPKATLAYVNTSFDDLDILGAGVAFDDGDSLRGRLGARVGTTIDHGGNLITPYVEASVWNEFSGDYSAAFEDVGGTPSVGYDAGGTYGEVVAGADFANVGAGWTAFGKGAVQFGEDEMLGFSGNFGLRKSW